MKRLAALSVLLFALAVSVARAQTVTVDDLSQATLGPDDLPGFSIGAEHPLEQLDVFQATWQRGLVADDQAGTGSLSVVAQLMAASSSAPLSALQSAIRDNLAFTTASNGGMNFSIGPRLGIGDLDTSAQWVVWNEEDATWYTVYADTFIQGRLVSAVIVVSQSDFADPSLLAPIAQLQASKSLLYGIPAALAPAVTFAPSNAPVPIPVTRPSSPAPAVPAPAPAGPSGGTPSCPNGFIPSPGNGRGPTLCRDGLCSHSAGSGTCSGHGGVAELIAWHDRPLAA